MVVTKYLFQFGFFPWNDGTVQESPFYPPRILGIEQTDNYANVDIALLLALFIHRSILKVGVMSVWVLLQGASYMCFLNVLVVSRLLRERETHTHIHTETERESAGGRRDGGWKRREREGGVEREREIHVCVRVCVSACV